MPQLPFSADLGWALSYSYSDRLELGYAFGPPDCTAGGQEQTTHARHARHASMHDMQACNALTGCDLGKVLAAYCCFTESQFFLEIPFKNSPSSPAEEARGGGVAAYGSPKQRKSQRTVRVYFTKGGE